ncbi:tRNA-dihydrouridine(47) synthase [NAD(P)(+)] [Lecanosticta acicola]|uniref:tRNA-dihydrouridine(47) synthase [NAD(P)(+)] n=1 Tax=Lecanosticta acicola TaxID=111012 RepID=A0AAI8YR59_9PEZI|nr:tRNA-dihydrouridine(47) synthase [NAD(P)(+)] [Lecanosticta acicola]
MGADFRRPPLPAPTESMDEASGADTEVATNVTSKTSYSIPEDGSPITISTQKVHGSKEGGIGKHSRDKSQTSLLIEYFEASKTGDKSRTRPSVRVKVTPSSAKKNRGSGGNDAVQITGIGADRKPSYTRRISLGNSSKNVETGLAPTEGTELSHSSGSNVSGKPPIEVEVLNNASDVSNNRSSRGLMYAPVESNVSSMPSDSMLEGEEPSYQQRSRDTEYDEDDATPTKEAAYLSAPAKGNNHTRNISQERLTQKVMEKLGASSKNRKSSRSNRDRNSKEYEYENESRERRRRSSRSHRGEEDTVSGAESSIVSSNLAPSQRSYRSGSSQASRVTNNPRLVEMVEDAIKRVIMPEINALKEDQKGQRSSSGREAPALERGGIERRVSKSSSTPNISSRPKVVLNRDGDDPGTVLSRGDSERVKPRKSSRESPSERPSSRRSSGRHSRQSSHDDTEERIRHKSSRGSNTLRGAAAAGLAGGLTAAALKQHDSQGDLTHRRKKRSSRRSESMHDMDELKKQDAIPPMPMASQINDSEVTRESILSTGTDRPQSRSSAEHRTPIREVSRGSLGESMSPASSRTPTRSPMHQHLGMSISNRSIESPHSPRSPNGGILDKARLPALTSAGLGGAAVAKGLDADGYGGGTPQRKISSPVQSVSSLRKNFEDDPLVPQALRPHSPASHSSAGRLRDGRHSQSSLRSMESPPTTKLADSRKHSQDLGADEEDDAFGPPHPQYTRDGAATPSGGETADEWFERQHLVNDRYRNLTGESTNRDSYQTNPFPQDEKRFTFATNDSFDRQMDEDETTGGEQDVRGLELNPNYVHTPMAVESAVASLMEPSTVSSHVVSSNGSPAKANGTYSDRMAQYLRAMDKEHAPMYEGSTMSQSMPSQDRWAAIRGHAANMSGSLGSSAGQSPAKDARGDLDRSTEERPTMGASGLPLADDPMPEIGHFDDSKSDVTTNPSIIQGPLGGDVTGKDTWPYTPEPQQDAVNRETHSNNDGRGKGAGILEGAAALGGAAAVAAAAHSSRQPTVEDERDLDREATPTGFRDEGYVTDARTRSGGGLTPKPEEQQYGKKDLAEYERAMNAQDVGEDDPFAMDHKHTRHFSGNSHGMDSPLYDASTGKGLQNIESKEIVALMDHLTVRDAQRNARDTEILVTLVRSAAEMRQSFDEIKKFIVEQDKLIMQNTDRTGDSTAQKVILSGPRPQPLGSPRTPRRQADPEEDVQTKRKGVLRRALKGLTGGKSAKDLTKIEDMLMQILDNVEDLKMQNGSARPLDRSYTNDSLDSYEKLRNAPDSGYEPEGQAGTSSTPSHSGHFNAPQPREKQLFHSGYDGRRGSEHRVSTVPEDDEDDLEPHETHILNHQFEHNERMLTPTQESHRNRGMSPNDTPPQNATSYGTPEKQRKHTSNNSSLFGVPKVSRWSRTTASSAPDQAALDSPKQARNARPLSASSRSQSTLDDYEDDPYHAHPDDRLRSTQSLGNDQARSAETRSMRSQASRLTRTPSPLIPSETSSRRDQYDDDDQQVPSPVQEDEEAAALDDPKYHAHRNSILLQHPQPRQGTTPRHQNTLESQAHTFDDPAGTNSDLSQRTMSDFDPAIWGSSGTAGLARHRLTQQMEPIRPSSMKSPKGYGSRNDNGPLVPQQKPAVPPKISYDAEPEREPEWEPQFSNSGFSKDAGYYGSPYGSGHLLEPIEEVRYSLETDSGRRSLKSASPEPQVVSARAVDMRSPGPKITGPRPMGAAPKSASTNTQSQPRLVDHAGTVRRKPVPRSEGSDDAATF